MMSQPNIVVCNCSAMLAATVQHKPWCALNHIPKQPTKKENTMIDRLEYLRSGENSAAIVNKLNEVIEEVNRLVEYNNPFATHKERLKLQEELLFVPKDSAKEKETPNLAKTVSETIWDVNDIAIANYKKRLLAQLKDAVAIQELSFTAPEHTPGLYEAIKIVEETD